MIPKKLYFSFGTDDLPSSYQKNLECWKKNCLDWEIYLYTDEKIYAFFHTHFPNYYEELPKISYGAILADLFRYAVLYVYGGLYSDIDTIPLQKIPEDWLIYDCVIGYEYQPSKFPHSRRFPWYDKEFMCQWTLFSAPCHPLFKEALDGAFNRLRKKNFQIKKVEEVLEISGPFLITELIKKYKTDQTVLILDADYFGCWPEAGFAYTNRTIVAHQFEGKYTWKAQIDCPYFRLNKGSL